MLLVNNYNCIIIICLCFYVVWFNSLLFIFMFARPEYKLVEEIVKDILKKLNQISSSDFKSLVGINSCIERIKTLLRMKLIDIHIIGIWGMGGIGTITIAWVVFNQISTHFESCYFVANVRKQSEKHRLIHLRDKLFSKILDDENINSGLPNLGFTFLIARQAPF